MTGLTQAVPAGTETTVVTVAAYAKKDGRTVMVARLPAGELAIMAEETAGAADWRNVLGPYALADLVAHADACIVGDTRALTDAQGHRALAMAVVALMQMVTTAAGEAGA